MNMLAHLHLASLAGSSIIGNAAADFVKGDPYLQYSSSIADGIMMHRRLDNLIDRMPEVKFAKSLFITEHQRVAPITLDIVWDHFLSKLWFKYNDVQSIHLFCQNMWGIINKDIHYFSHEFQSFSAQMWQGNWLIKYADLEFIGKVLNGMANRRPKLTMLRFTVDDIKKNYIKLENLFNKFYPYLMQQAIESKL